MTTQLKTGSNSEIFTLSCELLQMKIKGLKLRHRFQLRQADLNSLADELALEIAKPDWDREPFPDLPITPLSSGSSFPPSAQKRRN